MCAESFASSTDHSVSSQRSTVAPSTPAGARLLGAERRVAGVQRRKLAGGNVDDPAAAGELERLAGCEQILVQRQ